MFEGGFMHQAFAFGGEEGQDAFDKQIIYRSSLQNFLIDTGSEVILIDTGFKSTAAPIPKKLGAPLYMGEKVANYMDALQAMGYTPEQVTKILITHKHPEHTDCIGHFPHAQIFVGPEDADAMKLALRTSCVLHTAHRTRTSRTHRRLSLDCGSSRQRDIRMATVSSFWRTTGCSICSTVT